MHHGSSGSWILKSEGNGSGRNRGLETLSNLKEAAMAARSCSQKEAKTVIGRRQQSQKESAAAAAANPQGTDSGKDFVIDNGSKFGRWVLGI